MGYARSASLKAFQAKVEASRKVVKAAERMRFGGAKRPLYQASMRSSSILLTFANFESYVNDALNDVCKGFCSAVIPASKLPPELRTQIAIIQKIKQWAEVKDPVKLHSQVWAQKEGGGFSMLDDNAIPSALDVDALVANTGYPKFDNIIKLMRRIGMADPKTALKKVGGYSIDQKLTSFHDARAELAHTGKLPIWSFQDYLDRLDDLEDFAKALDKCICSHFCRYAGMANWIT